MITFVGVKLCWRHVTTTAIPSYDGGGGGEGGRGGVVPVRVRLGD